MQDFYAKGGAKLQGIFSWPSHLEGEHKKTQPKPSSSMWQNFWILCSSRYFSGSTKFPVPEVRCDYVNTCISLHSPTFKVVAC